MDKAIITHRLDLVVMLIDTTTGTYIRERNVAFLDEGEKIPFMFKGSGVYILMNSERKNTTFEVVVTGYENAKISVEYGESSKKAPEIFVNLVPKETSYNYAGIITMEGTLKGIESIDAVEYRHHDRLFQNYNPRNNLMTFFGGGELTEQEYALVLEKESRFVVFKVRRKHESFSVVLKEPLEEGINVGTPIERIIRGAVMSEDRYILRVRDTGQNVTYLVRYVVNGEVKFKKIDFKNDDERTLD